LRKRRKALLIASSILSETSRPVTFTLRLLLTYDHTFDNSQLSMEAPGQRILQDSKIRDPENPEDPAYR
jgi:hypothetical protein